ncbi:zinc/iron regulated transporter-related protein 48C isoform X2 [Tachypleus tridentatus]|uniref:zinc/iron regulated transporter-related protein 48C isoform X2 n=1 Tax=Tachypleus tridentatus TaxID=6853 RepID=UPI003FD69843
MIKSFSPVQQTLLGTFLTWGVTAAGASLVFVFDSKQRKVLDGSLGFAAGVMMAASFWSLLEPGLEIAKSSHKYGQYAVLPIILGFILGAFFVYGMDVLMPYLGIHSPGITLALHSESKLKKEAPYPAAPVSSGCKGNLYKIKSSSAPVERVRKHDGLNNRKHRTLQERNTECQKKELERSWKRIFLLLVAITVHNIPGLAVGVGFGAVNKTKFATFENARNLAIGIGIQNFPEGLAVSLPLHGAGISYWKSFWYGQLSGIVEPVAGLLGVVAVSIAEPLLPYALAFAAGAMVYVVFDDIIPEANMGGNGSFASWFAIFGFLLMMTLDVAFA